MCTVSMIAQDWHNRHPNYYPMGPRPDWSQDPFNRQPMPDLSKLFVQPVTREEFEALKKELAAVKELLLAAKKYDEATGQKDCEDPEKVAIFKRLAEITGVSMADVFPEVAK